MGEITCRDLVCTRGNFTLRIEDLTLRSGEKTALLGENGCGKTTFLQILAGILPSGGGHILYNQSQRWDQFTPRRRSRHMAYLPQDAGVLFNLTVEELVELTLDSRTLLTGEKREEVLKAAEMQRYLNRVYHSLSGGEKRRAMLARIFCRNPEFIFLDEPTAPLDMRHAAHIMDFARRAPGAVVAAMHDINLAVRYFDRFLLMKDGRILFDKRKGELHSSMLEEIYGIKLTSCGDHFIPLL